MDQATKDRIQHEIEDEVRTLFPGAVRRVDWEPPNDPHFEPGELIPSLILTEPPGRSACSCARMIQILEGMRVATSRQWRRYPAVVG